MRSRATTTPESNEIMTALAEPSSPTDDDAGATRTTPKPRARRGFAAMARERVVAISRIGGKAAHSAGTAHTFTSEEARATGKKGGRAAHRTRGRRLSPDDGSRPTDAEPEGASERTLEERALVSTNKNEITPRGVDISPRYGV